MLFHAHAGWNENWYHGNREEHSEEAARDWQRSIAGTNRLSVTSGMFSVT